MISPFLSARLVGEQRSDTLESPAASVSLILKVCLKTSFPPANALQLQQNQTLSDREHIHSFISVLNPALSSLVTNVSPYYSKIILYSDSFKWPWIKALMCKSYIICSDYNHWIPARLKELGSYSTQKQTLTISDIYHNKINWIHT